MKSRKKYLIASIGFVMAVIGLYLSRTMDYQKDTLTALPYLLIGVGCGAFGHGMGDILAQRALRNDPERQKEIEINTHDERNITIANCAKAKAYDFMIYVFGALLLSFALMEVDVILILLLAFAYLLVQGYALYYRVKLDNKM